MARPLSALALSACLAVPTARAQPTTVQLTPDPLPDANWHQIFFVPIVGGASVEVSDPAATGNIEEFEITGDGSRVVYLTETPAQLHSVLIEGGGGLPINLLPVWESCWEMAADGSRVAYVALEPYNAWLLVYSVPTTGGSAIAIGGAPDAPFNGAACPIVSSPGGSWLAHANYTGGQYGWSIYVTSFTGSSNGHLQTLAFPPDDHQLAFSSDDQWIAIGGTEDEIYSRNLVTHEEQTLSVLYPELKVTPAPLQGEYHVVFYSHYYETLSSVPISLAGSTEQLAPNSSSRFEISSDGQHVVYRSSWDLFSVPTLGGSSTQLNAALPQMGIVLDFLVSSGGRRVVFTANPNDPENFELFSVDIAGGAVERLSPQPEPWMNVEGFRISADGATVVYRADLAEDERFELFSVPILGGESLKISSDIECPICSVRTVRDDLSITPDDRYVLFRTGFVSDPEPAEVLFSVELDTDGDADGVLDRVDCDSGDDQVWSLPGQVTDLTLRPLQGSPEVTVLDWTAPVEPGGLTVQYDLLRAEAVDSFVTSGDISCVLAGGAGTSVEDPDVPSDAFFYLARAVNACGNGEVGENREGADVFVCP
jgi:Tol biopolymer transport system component